MQHHHAYTAWTQETRPTRGQRHGGSGRPKLHMMGWSEGTQNIPKLHQIQWCLMIFIGLKCLNIIFPIKHAHAEKNWRFTLHQTWRRGAISLAKYPRPGHRSSRGLEWVPCSAHASSCPRPGGRGLKMGIYRQVYCHFQGGKWCETMLNHWSWVAVPSLRPYMAEDGEYFCNFQQGVRAGLSRHSLSKRTVSFFCSYEWKNQLQGTWHNPVQEWQTELAVRQQALWDQHHPLKVPPICEVFPADQVLHRCLLQGFAKAWNQHRFFFEQCEVWDLDLHKVLIWYHIVHLYGLYNIVDIYIYIYDYIRIYIYLCMCLFICLFIGLV